MKEDDEDIEEQLARSYKVGIFAGLEEAAVLVMKEATEFFQLGKDDRARYLRELAEKLKKAAKERHPGVPGAKKK